jgi:glycosyltransferase involved in cell wall biosynthesis
MSAAWHGAPVGERLERPFRLLLVMEEVRCGGAELAFFGLCQALASRCELHVALSEKSLENDTIRAQCRVLASGSARVHSCRHLLNSGTLANLHRRLRRPAALELADMLRSLSCDLLLVNLPTVERGQSVLDAAELVSPRPPVWGYVHLAQPPSIIGAKLGRLRDRLVPSLLQRFDGLLGVSQAGARELSQRYGLPPAEVLYPATPALTPAPAADRARLRAAYGLGGGALLGIVGRVGFHHKGQDAALRITGRLVGEGRPVHLVVVGDGPDLPALERLADRLGLSRHVSFLGWRHDVASLMPLLDLIVMPSRYEGMPQTALQAATAGVPVVGYAVDGLAELLPSQFTAPRGDESRLAAVIAAVLEGSSSWPRQELAERAARWGSPDRAAEQLIRLCQTQLVQAARTKEKLKVQPWSGQ